MSDDRVAEVENAKLRVVVFGTITFALDGTPIKHSSLDFLLSASNWLLDREPPPYRCGAEDRAAFHPSEPHGYPARSITFYHPRSSSPT